MASNLREDVCLPLEASLVRAAIRALSRVYAAVACQTGRLEKRRGSVFAKEKNNNKAVVH